MVLNKKTDELKGIIINNAFDAIVYYVPVKDSEGQIVDFQFAWLNDSATNFLRGNREKYLGQNFLRLFPYDAQNGMFSAFKKTAETGEPSEDVYYYECGNHKGWYRNSVLKYDDGIIVYFRDITPQKKLELELKENNEHLRKLLNERELLLKETHHRVKNNLQLVSSILNLQKDSIQDLYYQEIFNVCIQRLKTMALIHQQLYEDNLFGEINLGTFSSTIINSLVGVYNPLSKNIRVNLNVTDIVCDFDYAVKIGLILNELVTNSMKYAFQGLQEGEISITIQQQLNNIYMEIKDNGIGLPKDFENKTTTSLGLILVKSLIQDLDGKLDIKTKPGTSFYINLPPCKVIDK